MLEADFTPFASRSKILFVYFLNHSQLSSLPCIL